LDSEKTIMEQSTNRILTTHAGSLPRPDDLARMMYDVLDEKPIDQAAIDARVRTAVAEVVEPHHKDVAQKDIVKLVLKSRAKFIYVEAANPQHEHEWIVWNDVKLPDDKALILGVIDTKTNTIEHPELMRNVWKGSQISWVKSALSPAPIAASEPSSVITPATRKQHG
jgi:methionine synthase II (cobalamin-independent)